MMSDKFVLIASNFPPVLGGSAVVYENIAKFSPGQAIIMAPRLNYVDGLPLIGWREHDRRAPYRVIRLPLLRTLLEPKSRRGWIGSLAFRAADIIIRCRLVAALIRILVTDRPVAICFGELLATGWLLVLISHFHVARTVAYVHGEEITTIDPYDPQHRRARRVLRHAEIIVVVSRFTLEAVRRLLGDDAKSRIQLIENGVDNSRFRPLERRADLVKRYRLDGAFVFISVCRLLEKKGVDQALRAFAQVSRRYPECRYLIVGTGAYEAELRDIAAEIGVADKVVFAGQVADEDLPDHYSLGDVFVMPNRELASGDTEGFGLVFLEANACGLPVIAGRDGGSRDAVQHGENGLIVDGRSVDDIAAAMIALKSQDDLRDRLRRRGREIAAMMDWRSKAQLFLRICQADTPKIG